MADSLTWKVPANASRGSTAGSRSRGSRGEQHVELQLGALRRAARAPARRAAGPARRGATLASTCPAAAAPPSQRTSPSGSIAVTSTPQRISAPAVRAAPRERVGERAHAADRHVPVALAVADHVVEEAAVLAQRRLVGGGEGPDQPVGERDPALDVVVEGRLDRLAQRPLEQRLPGGVLGDLGAQRLACRQRLREGGEDAPADARGHRVELAPARRAAPRRCARAARSPSGRGV